MASATSPGKRAAGARRSPRRQPAPSAEANTGVRGSVWSGRPRLREGPRDRRV